jgi:hypothetical protein
MVTTKVLTYLLAAASLVAQSYGQTFQRLGACPKLGCIFPPDQYVIFL